MFSNSHYHYLELKNEQMKSKEKKYIEDTIKTMDISDEEKNVLSILIQELAENPNHTVGVHDLNLLIKAYSND